MARQLGRHLLEVDLGVKPCLHELRLERGGLESLGLEISLERCDKRGLRGGLAHPVQRASGCAQHCPLACLQQITADR